MLGTAFPELSCSSNITFPPEILITFKLHSDVLVGMVAYIFLICALVCFGTATVTRPDPSVICSDNTILPDQPLSPVKSFPVVPVLVTVPTTSPINLLSLPVTVKLPPILPIMVFPEPDTCTLPSV